MSRKLVAALFLVVAVLTVTNDSRADGNWWWGGSPYGYNRININQSDRQIPYFAQHPPVYYSHIVPRSYGQSPYAYWPGPYTPSLSPEPIMVPNPYAPGVEELPAQPKKSRKSKKHKTSLDKSVKARVSGGPLVVLNPYVTQQPAVAASEK